MQNPIYKVLFHVSLPAPTYSKTEIYNDMSFVSNDVAIQVKYF